MSPQPVVALHPSKPGEERSERDESTARDGLATFEAKYGPRFDESTARDGLATLKARWRLFPPSKLVRRQGQGEAAKYVAWGDDDHIKRQTQGACFEHDVPSGSEGL